jgi:hypothetical protein
METVIFQFKGVSNLLMHSARGVDPLDPGVIEHKKLTAIRKKTDETHAMIARSEWEIGLYFDPTEGPIMPTANLRGVIVEGAKFSKLGASVKRGTIVEQESARIDYKGPRSLDEMWKAGSFRDVRAVVVGGARVMRCRPRFCPPWSVEFSLLFDPEVITREQLVSAAEAGGRLVGLGDFRPANGGPFGRFTVEAA